MTPAQEAAATIAQLEAVIETLRTGMDSLAAYVTSPKFREDTTVQTGDIVARLREIRSAAADVEVEPYGASCDLRKTVWGSLAAAANVQWRGPEYRDERTGERRWAGVSAR